MKFLTLMTPLPMPISLRKTSLHHSALRVTPFPADCISYELPPLHNKLAPLHDFFCSLQLHSLCPKQDTRNALDDIDTSRIASFLLEEHSNSQYSKHSMIKNRPEYSFYSSSICSCMFASTGEGRFSLHANPGPRRFRNSQESSHNSTLVGEYSVLCSSLLPCGL